MTVLPVSVFLIIFGFIVFFIKDVCTAPRISPIAPQWIYRTFHTALYLLPLQRAPHTKENNDNRNPNSTTNHIPNRNASLDLS